MMDKQNIIFKYLGQSGIFCKSGSFSFMIDPYLSNSVEELEAKDLKRKIPIPFKPNEINNLDWIFVTHEHIDHCDPHTLPILEKNNKNLKIVGPEKVRKKLLEWGIPQNKIIKASKKRLKLAEDIFMHSIPAAHPTLTYAFDGEPNEIGWILEIKRKKILFTGDTSLTEEIISSLKEYLPIELGFLPVNEDNFFRRRRGIIGNMSIREAFGLADELNIKTVFPVHWDLFDVNSTLIDEIKAVYRGYKWKFALTFSCEEVI